MPKHDEKPHKMKVKPGTPPGMEVDNHGDPIPLEQRTKEDRERAIAAGETSKKHK